MCISDSNKAVLGYKKRQFLLDHQAIQILGTDNLGNRRILKYGMSAVVGKDFERVGIKAYSSLQRFSSVIRHLLGKLLITGGFIKEKRHYQTYDTYKKEHNARTEGSSKDAEQSENNTDPAHDIIQLAVLAHKCFHKFQVYFFGDCKFIFEKELASDTVSCSCLLYTSRCV